MDALAEVCEQVAKFGSRLKKVALVGDYLRPLGDDDLRRAVHMLCCGPPVRVEQGPALFATDEARTLSIGGATLRDAYLSVTGWDADTLRLCHREVGDTGETIGLLLPGHTRGEPLSLAQAEERYSALYQTRKTADKVAILEDVFRNYRPLTVKYFVKVITGNLRIGLQSRMVEEAIALATGVPHSEVREANNRLGDLPGVALAARHGELHRIEARLFHPMDFMLAKPLEIVDNLGDPENYIVEEKYDGIRSQVHFADGEATIYTRGMDEVTAAFPELELAFKKLIGSAVLDGEILAWENGRALSFTVLQQRLARKKVAASMMAGIPVAFMAYDILYRNGELLLERPLEERRALMEQTLAGQGLPLLLSPQARAESTADIDRMFEASRANGNEGLILKRRGSAYEPGRRSGTWWKVKRPHGTLDVVITAAEQGNGRRATMLSDYTFAVKSGERFLNVGKAYSGLTDAEIKELTKLLKTLASERFGRVMLVRPEVVLEVAFDGVQKSPRHKSGYALRFPRIVRWRQDKKADEVDDLERVRELYETSLTKGRE